MNSLFEIVLVEAILQNCATNTNLQSHKVAGVKKMIQTSLIASPITLRRVTPVAFEIPELPQIGKSIFSGWRWRGIRSVNDSVGKPEAINYQSFRPDVLSEGRHQRFVWLEYIIGKSRVVLRIGDISDCDFSNEDPCKELLVPIGWARVAVALINVGVTGVDESGRMVCSNGDTGRFMNQPELQKFELAY